jgi:hypothetical protein
MGTADSIFGTSISLQRGEADCDGRNKTQNEGSELPEPEAEELMEEDAPGPAKGTKRAYSREQLGVLERECFGGTMTNADISAAITRLEGAREVTKQDVRAWRAKAKNRR